MNAVNTCHIIIYFFDENRNQQGVAIVTKISVSICKIICIKVQQKFTSAGEKIV